MIQSEKPKSVVIQLRVRGPGGGWVKTKTITVYGASIEEVYEFIKAALKKEGR
mgnify:CR=1 FL=1